MDFGEWFHQNCMLGDRFLTASKRMKQTDHHWHGDGLLQEFCAMTQKHNESREVCCETMAVGKVQLQSREVLGSTPDE